MTSVIHLLATDHFSTTLWDRPSSKIPLNYDPYGFQSRISVAHLLYQGELCERSTSSYLLGAGHHRRYAPVLLRFTTPDSWSPFGAGGLNAYAYCEGDPVNHQDPTGHAITPEIAVNRWRLNIRLLQRQKSMNSAPDLQATPLARVLLHNPVADAVLGSLDASDLLSLTHVDRATRFSTYSQMPMASLPKLFPQELATLITHNGPLRPGVRAEAVAVEARQWREVRNLRGPRWNEPDPSGSSSSDYSSDEDAPVRVIRGTYKTT